MLRHLLLCGVCGVILGFALVGCEARHTSDATAEEIDPVAMAKEMDKEAAKDLAESKIDAKQWLASDKHGTFEARKLDIVKFTNDCLAAGATGVWVSGPEQIEGKELIDMLYIELPTDAAKRAKVFAVYNKANEEDPEKDLGQKFLVYSWD